MKILFIGDVVGPAGCLAIRRYVPQIKEAENIDFVIVNAENASFHGMNKAIVEDFYKSGVDGVTSGNHMWDDQGIYEIIDSDPRIIRPMNWIEKKPGQGWTILEKKGRKLLLVNALGKLLMGEGIADPFPAIDAVVRQHVMGRDVDGILVDFHAETTAEKQAVGHYFDGRVSMVVGTHTHVPTSDQRILPGGTAYQTDVGMTCDYDSNIGVFKDHMLGRFLGTHEKDKNFSPASGDPTLCGLIVETAPATGLATSVKPVRIGGCLAQTGPFDLLQAAE